MYRQVYCACAGIFQLVVPKDSRMRGIFNSNSHQKCMHVRIVAFLDNQLENQCMDLILSPGVLSSGAGTPRP